MMEVSILNCQQVIKEEVFTSFTYVKVAILLYKNTLLKIKLLHLKSTLYAEWPLSVLLILLSSILLL